MKIDPPIAPIDPIFTSANDSIQVQTQNREIIQAVRAINASVKLGENNELTFSLDRQTRRTVIKIVDRVTNEVIQQIPEEQVLRLAEDLKDAEDRG
jgi:flagellar protein FlaG